MKNLKPYHRGDKSDEDIKKEAESSQEEYVPNEILNHRTDGEQLRFLVSWQGYDTSESTWEPYANLGHLHIVKSYMKRHKLRDPRGQCQQTDK